VSVFVAEPVRYREPTVHPAADIQTPTPYVRHRLGLRGGAALLLALAIVTAGCSGGQDAATNDSASSTPAAADTKTVPETTTTTPAAPLAATVARVRDELRGIPQKGLVLGSPSAPVTIVDYGHFACPTCAAVHGTVLPKVIERYVRTGKASIEFRGIAGDAASPARDLALGAYAAAAQRHGWEFVQLAYRRNLERVGAPPEPSARLAAALGLDARGWNDDLESPAWSAQVKGAAGVAAIARFSTYPVFLVRARDNSRSPFVVLTNPGSVGAFAGAIAKARKAGS